MDLFFRQVGDGSPVIILHGLFGFSDNWMTIAKRLGEKHKVFVPDLRNHGQSFHSEEWNYNVMVEDLLNLIVKNEIENPVILGHSMGGKVAMNFAAKYPDILKKLIIVDIAPRFYPIHHQSILDGLMNLDLGNVSSRSDADHKLAQSVPEADVRLFLLKNIARDSDGKFIWKLNLPVISENIENVGVGLLYSGITFAKPTLFIRGSRSGYVQPEDFKNIAEIYENCNFVTIANSGHWVHAENPVVFFKTVDYFLDL